MKLQLQLQPSSGSAQTWQNGHNLGRLTKTISPLGSALLKPSSPFYMICYANNLPTELCPGTATISGYSVAKLSDAVTIILDFASNR